MEPAHREQIEGALHRVRWWKERIRHGETGPFLVSLASIERHARTGLPVTGPLLDLRILQAFVGLAEVNLSERLGATDG